jgi:hypothetical protein
MHHHFKPFFGKHRLHMCDMLIFRRIYRCIWQRSYLLEISLMSMFQNINRINIDNPRYQECQYHNYVYHSHFHRSIPLAAQRVNQVPHSQFVFLVSVNVHTICIIAMHVPVVGYCVAIVHDTYFPAALRVASGGAKTPLVNAHEYEGMIM